MTRIILFVHFLTLTLAATCFAAPRNIILIYADDIGYGDIGCYGGTIPTPHIDRLAQRGLRFTSGYAPSATCTPSRFSLLTGKHPFRQPRTGVTAGDANLIIDPDTTTVADILKQGGYTTGIVGKWHLGLGQGPIDWNTKIAPGPLELGFDYAFLMPATGDRVPCVYVENHRVVNLDPDDPIRVSYTDPFPGEPNGIDNRDELVMDWSHGHNQAVIHGIGRIGYMTGGKTAIWDDTTMADVFVEKSLAFIDAHKDEPFFLFFSAHDNHVPRLPHLRFEGISGQGPRGDAVVQFDWCVGRIVTHLESLGLLEDTLIIITSDNGPVLDDGYVDQANELLGDHKPAGPLRGGKYSIFEGGTRVSFIVSWPKRLEPGVSDAMLSQVDFSATFAALTGQSLPPDVAPDSVNVLPALLGDSSTGRDHIIHHAQLRNTAAIRQGPWKFIPGNTPVREQMNPAMEKPFQTPEEGLLFNLDDDLGETTNVIEQHPQIAQELRQRLEAIRRRSEPRP